MRPTPRPVATVSPGQFTTLQVLLLMLILLSIGYLLACMQVRSTPSTVATRLRSTWFNSLPDSGNTINSAALHGAGRLVADQTCPVAQALASA